VLDVELKRPRTIAAAFVRLNSESMTVRLKDDMEVGESPDTGVVVVGSIDQAVVQ
jgi:hypothetical protein